MPKISIIMAVYNCQDTVSKSIESILTQTYADWEFIICDDCSTDSTYEIVLNYQKKYPNKIVAIRNKQNSRLAYSLNHCLKYAKGEYVARMDGDDISLPTRLEEQIRFLESNKDIQLVGTSMEIFDGEKVVGIRTYKKNVDKYDMIKNPCFAHATIMTYKYVYDSLNGYLVSKRTERGQDHDLWFRFFAKGYKGANLEKPLYRVLEDDNCYKRKKWKYRIHSFQTTIIGYRSVNMPVKYYIWAFKPLLVGFIPRKLMKNIKENKVKSVK